MKKRLVALVVPLCILVLFTGSAAAGEERSVQASSAPYLTPAELENLLAPVALYPDPLLAQLLPAATFTGQIREAARFLERYGSSAQLDRQHWDVSVKAVAHYPDVLFMMDRKYQWTVTVGQAFLNQEPELFDAIQRLRRDAYDAGNLRSTREQEVLVQGSDIRIVPADPAYLYLPQYDPAVVYDERPDPGYPFVTFGLGFTIGSWLNRDCDWHARRIYYHGWRDRGWVKRSRPHVETRNRSYVGRSAGAIRVDRTVTGRDNRAFRQELKTFAAPAGAAAPAAPRYRVRRGPQLRPAPATEAPAERNAPRPGEPRTPSTSPAPRADQAPAGAPGQGTAPAPSAPSAAPHPTAPGSRGR